MSQASRVLEEPHLLKRLPYPDEPRWMAVGILRGVEVTKDFRLEIADGRLKITSPCFLSRGKSKIFNPTFRTSL